MHSLPFRAKGIRQSVLAIILIVAMLTMVLPSAVLGAPSQSAVQSASHSYLYHYVKAGETLSHIARYYGVTVNALLYTNHLTSSTIYVGQRLAIPNPLPARSCSTYHYVQKGDTLSGIAAWFGMSTYALASANGITNPNLIYLGQKICIPNIYNGGHYPPSSPAYHTVKVGDTLTKIAAWYQTTVHKLVYLNRLGDANKIYVGQVLRIR